MDQVKVIVWKEGKVLTISIHVLKGSEFTAHNAEVLDAKQAGMFVSKILKEHDVLPDRVR